MTQTEQVVLDFIDGMQQGVSLTVLIKSLPDHDPEEIKSSTRRLYDHLMINRLSVMGDNGRFYYVFYSLYVRTVTVHREPVERHETPAPTHDDGPDHGDTVLRIQGALGITTTGWVSPDVILDRIERAMAPAPASEALEAPPEPSHPPLVIPRILSPDQAVAVLEKGGWQAGPEITERRVADRRALTAMDVIDRWKLPYRLSRIIEIIASARKNKLDADDAVEISVLAREHVKKEAS